MPLLISYHIHCESNSKTCVIIFPWLGLWQLINIARLCLVCIWSIACFSFRPCSIFLSFSNLDSLSQSACKITMEVHFCFVTENESGSSHVKTLVPPATFSTKKTNKPAGGHAPPVMPPRPPGGPAPQFENPWFIKLRSNLLSKPCVDYSQV